VHKNKKQPSIVLQKMSLVTQPSSLYRIDPLTGDNYLAWKEKLQWTLIEQDLWGHASGDAMRPTPQDKNNVTAVEMQVISDWEKKDQETYAAI